MRRLLVGLGLLVLVLAGCSSADEPAGTGDQRTRQESGSGLPTDIDYVAIGDSYTAGPLVATMRNDPPGCYRSQDNYPAFLADWLDVASYTDVSCSGAVSGDLTGRQRMLDGSRVRPQLEALSEDTDLVTIGIGGNDFGIYATLVGCQRAGTANCSADLVARLERKAAKVQDRIVKVVVKVDERSPDAAVYVVGYPQVLPSSGACEAVAVSGNRLESVSRVAVRLNRSLRRGAEKAGASFIDLEKVSAGHDVCAGKAAWVNGPQFLPGVAAPFHPVLAGMRGAAAEVYREITGQEPDETERANPSLSVVKRNVSDAEPQG